jgi:hypothetical protein
VAWIFLHLLNYRQSLKDIRDEAEPRPNRAYSFFSVLNLINDGNCWLNGYMDDFKNIVLIIVMSRIANSAILRAAFAMRSAGITD